MVELGFMRFLAVSAGLIMLAGAGARAQTTAVPPPQAPQAGGTQQNPAGEPQARSSASTDVALKQRVEQLEEQLVDLQVVIGTLESLARSGASNTSAAASVRSGGLSAADSGRLDAIETQVRALASQLEQLSNEIRGGNAGQRSEATPPPAAVTFGAPVEPRPNAFGAPTVTTDTLDPIGGLIENDGAVAEYNPGAGAMRPDAYSPGAPPTVQAAPPVVDASNPKQLYEAAYGHLLRQDYGAAQAGFTEFLRRHPSDTLAPDALFWLGETHYVQRNYHDAAEAFDLVTTSFSSSTKAPDAQLKRAMALAQSGKRNEACTAIRELGTKFPNARPAVKSKAEAERQRVGCT